VQFRTPDSVEEWWSILRLFLVRHVESAKAGGVVVGMSGGLDSAVVASLAVRALGRDRVLPLILPAPDSDPGDERDARLACTALGLDPVVRPLGPMLEGFAASAGRVDDAVRANATSRLRMLLLYAEAQSRGWLVCGTSNKSELLTGYFTKHGDGAADLQPIGDLYKTQVRQLAAWLGVPQAILAKPPSAGLRPGQTDEGDLGIAYEELDAILKGLELNRGVDAVVRRTGLPASKVQRVEQMVRRTEHKRRLALIPKLGVRTVGVDWRRSVQWDA
jgi:NAD+ synthase